MRASDDLYLKARQAAEDYLRARGFTVLDRDWDSPDGKIPIVAEETGTLVAVHVTRMGGRYHAPLERAGKRRGTRLRRAAVRWLKDHGMHRERLRVDVIGLLPEHDGGFAIEHIRAVA